MKVRDFSLGVVDEMKKVTWPDGPQLKSATVVILIFCAIVAVIIKAMDLVAGGIVGAIIGIFSR